MYRLLRHSNFLLMTIVFFISGVAGGCTPVISAAKLAYDWQINLMRRGLPRATALGLYTEFIANLAAKSWENGSDTNTFGSTCIDDSYLSMLQNENGELLSAVHLETKVTQSIASVPLLPQRKVPFQTAEDCVANIEWSNTEGYFLGSIPRFVNVSRLDFPIAAEIRFDPFKDQACNEYEKYSNDTFSTTPATGFTATVLSLVMQLIDNGANATKAVQLLRHTVGYTFVAIRCRGTEMDDLQMPTVFLRAYARQAGALGRNMASTGSTPSAYDLLTNAAELLHLLTSFRSGGKLPEYVITTSGLFRNTHFLWNSLSDIRTNIFYAKIAVEDNSVYLQKLQVASQAAIDAAIASEDGKTFRLSRIAKKYYGDEFLASIKPVALLHVVGTGVFSRVSTKSSMKLHSPETIRNPKFKRSISLRNVCGTGWVYVERQDVNAWLEQCCAPVCSQVIASLSILDSALFQESCCQACNEAECISSAQAASEGAAQLVGITVPPYSGEQGNAIPLMI